MEIRKANIKDLPTIKKICKKYKFELDRNWKGILNSKDEKVFLLLDKKNIIGFTGLTYYKWNNTIQIIDIFIKPAYRKKGLSLKLINFLIKRVKKSKYRCLIAETPSLNPVKKLYEKLGFRKCGYNDRYYSNNGKEICIWMSLDI